MRGQIPQLARVRLETITPLHIGAGAGGGKAMQDECLGGRPIPAEYRPPTERRGAAEVIRLRRGQRDRPGLPYVPASTLRGLLRGLYAGALEAAGVSNVEGALEQVFGSTESAGTIALDDLLPEGEARTWTTTLIRYKPAAVTGRRTGQSPSSFSVELVDGKTVFAGAATYVNEALPQVLRTILDQEEALTHWLRTGRHNEPNPETTIPGSPINTQPLFRRTGNGWDLVWKLGRYSKSYARALTRRRRIDLPHAYYLVKDTDEVPGWVRVTFELDPQGGFRLNEWPEEAGS